MRIKHRTILRTKELRNLLKKLENKPLWIHRLLRDTAPGKVPVEHVVLEDKTQFYLVQSEMWLVELQSEVVPGLPALIEKNVELPQVVVDMGAVPHIANGADVMAPGIYTINEDLKPGDLTVIIDQKNLVPLAVGRMLLTPKVIRDVNRGRAIETIHYVGDQLWKLAKELSE
ncbi:MAG: PUA domain-containing protein [Promethearchaeota archaeon]